MKCPACGKRLYRIQAGEYACPNNDCPSNIGKTVNSEWYGTQEEINSMFRPSEVKQT